MERRKHTKLPKTDRGATPDNRAPNPEEGEILEGDHFVRGDVYNDEIAPLDGRSFEAFKVRILRSEGFLWLNFVLVEL